MTISEMRLFEYYPRIRQLSVKKKNGASSVRIKCFRKGTTPMKIPRTCGSKIWEDNHNSSLLKEVNTQAFRITILTEATIGGCKSCFIFNFSIR